jgi:hypothetical protein
MWHYKFNYFEIDIYILLSRIQFRPSVRVCVCECERSDPDQVQNPSGSATLAVMAGPASLQTLTISKFFLVDYKQMSLQQQLCPSTLQTATEPSLKVDNVPMEGYSLLCDLSCA